MKIAGLVRLATRHFLWNQGAAADRAEHPDQLLTSLPHLERQLALQRARRRLLALRATQPCQDLGPV